MIHTSVDFALVLYDRKSRRHAWQLACRADRAWLDKLAAFHANQVNKPGWAGYQQKLVGFDTSVEHAFPDTLPANDQQGEYIYP